MGIWDKGLTMCEILTSLLHLLSPPKHYQILLHGNLALVCLSSIPPAPLPPARAGTRCCSRGPALAWPPPAPALMATLKAK